MPLLTVLTATYNRANLLPRLYRSLCDQTCDQFEWLVVDDGSTDNTQEIVKNWVTEAKVAIRYIQKVNGGKHTAVNLGVQSTHSPLTFIVDSDDWIIENAVQEIAFYHHKYQGCQTPICGFAYHRLTGGVFNGSPFPKDEQIDFYPEFQVNRWRGETAQVFFTSALREFPFPQYPGRRTAISEDIAWIQMGLKYATVYVKKALTISEYCPDGLTRNLRKSQNYLSQYHRGLLYLHPRISLFFRIRGALMVNVYARFCRIKPPRRFILLLMSLPGWLVYHAWKWKRQMEDEPALQEDVAP